MSLFLEALMRDAARRREWGECAWTAPDLFRPRSVIYMLEERARLTDRVWDTIAPGWRTA